MGVEETVARLEKLEEKTDDPTWTEIWDAIEEVPVESDWWHRTGVPVTGRRVAIWVRDNETEFLTIGWWTGTNWCLPEGRYEVLRWKEIL
jgi:hypothetical protein